MWANTRRQLAKRWLGLRWLASCLAFVAVCLSSQAGANQSHPNLPAGLPALPSIGERMATDDLSGIGLEGYDPVAYQLNGRPVAGLAGYEHSWQGVIWRFASEANRAAFAEAPETYAPKFEGYDASAVAIGRAVSADPDVFAVLNSRLYLFRTKDSRHRFLAEASLRDKAGEAWPSVSRQLTR
jgi:YHS domain-containing protein